MAEELELNGFMTRMQMGFGIFMTPADIEESDAMHTADLFIGIPNVQVRGFDQVLIRSFGGFCPPMIYVDGLPKMGRSTLGDIVVLQDVSAVEVYRHASELPIQYGGANDTGCGVVVFWTKSGL